MVVGTLVWSFKVGERKLTGQATVCDAAGSPGFIFARLQVGRRTSARVVTPRNISNMDISSSTTLFLLLATAGSILFFASRNAPAKPHGDGRVPPMLPSAFPLVGHLLHFLSDPDKFFTKAS